MVCSNFRRSTPREDWAQLSRVEELLDAWRPRQSCRSTGACVPELAWGASVGRNGELRATVEKDRRPLRFRTATSAAAFPNRARTNERARDCCQTSQYPQHVEPAVNKCGKQRYGDDCAKNALPTLPLFPYSNR